MQLKSLLSTLETHISYFDKVKHTVTSTTVGWQIEHILLTIKMITIALKKI
jgi:hypothetical protein